MRPGTDLAEVAAYVGALKSDEELPTGVTSALLDASRSRSEAANGGLNVFLGH